MNTRDATLLNKAFETNITINGQPSTLYEFLEQNYGSLVKDEHVKPLFRLKNGQQMVIDQLTIKRI